MTTFHLVRHAEKIGANVLAGRAPGVHLSERGHRQAEAIARFFEREPIDRIFSSPMDRARETAAPLARNKGLNLDLVDAFAELDFGNWTGRTPAQLAGDAQWERFNRFRAGTRAPTGESMLEAQARVVAALIDWRDVLAGQTVVVVSHAEPIRGALLHFLGASIDQWARLTIDLASVSTLELSADAARLTRCNVTVD